MIVYLAHPVGAGADRDQNLVNTQKWFLWLFHNTDWTIQVPWFIYVSNLTEEHRARAMRDDLRVLSTCDAICLTGGRVSEGMATERVTAKLKGLLEIDLTSVGYEPNDAALELIANQAGN